MSNAADFVALTETNFEILTAEIFKQQATYVSGVPPTIVYTDYVLARLIDLLETQAYPTAMLYVSDHGESLGEYSIYLHGLPRAIAPSQQAHIPMTFWASPDFLKAKTIDPELLAASRAKPYSHENLFHSFLEEAAPN